ncbi:MAG: ribosomal-processing cysteine protease Prp [Firmicutes bacterium HGW-Firmicutes-12]|jgi:hypothetical protein|nr:MAG: ribosomal-processing cysteine protease Prp [Firmicutes bacterium HGW-Firmicutes-12]
MIKAVIYYNSSVYVNGEKEVQVEYKGYVVEGHAEMGEPGYDLVCAAVSVLTQTALLGLDTYLTNKPKWRIDDHGYLECWLPNNLSNDERRAAEIVIHTMELGLNSIEKEYQKYLKVMKREVE